ncbi:hypothetical protein JCM17823_08710 [Halorubrum gandharaense]
MYRVLMPIDTNEDRALAQAEHVASLPDAASSVEVIVLFVFHGETEKMPAELREFGTAARVQSVRRAVDHLEERGVDVEVHGGSGDTVADILAVADEAAVDSIVLGGRKRSAAGKLLFGSVSQSLLQETDRPVTITGEQ